MAETLLKKAVKGNNKDSEHEHIAYIRPDNTGITSETKGHSHKIYEKKFQVTSVDQQGNLQTQEKSGGLKVEEYEGHTHTIEEIKVVEKKEVKQSDEELLKLNMKLYKVAKELNEKSRADSKEAEEFKKCNQWKQEDRAMLESKMRACLTIPLIKPKLDVLSGIQRQNRTDINVLPTEEGDQITSDMYRLRIKNICYQNNYDYEETRTFDDQCGLGAGYMDVNIKSSNDGIGEVEVGYKYWENIMFGPHIEMDGSDAEYAIVITPISKGKLKELYPEEADKIEKDFQDLIEEQNKPRSRSDRYVDKGKSITLEDFNLNDMPELVNIDKQSYRLIEVRRKVYRRNPVIFNAKHNFYYPAGYMSDKDFKAASSIEELRVINHTSFHIQIGIFAGKTFLRDEKSLFSQINIVPFYANKIGNYYWGKVREAKDCQLEANKWHSKAVDVVNKNAAHGIGISVDAFKDKAEFNNFKKNRNEAGFIAVFKDGFDPKSIHEFKGGDFPQEFVAMAEMHSNLMDKIMNVFPEMQGGASGANQSGVSIAAKQRAGMTGNEYLYDNFSFSKRRIGQLIIEAIQIVDSPEKILRIVENQNNNTLLNTDPINLYPKISPQQALQMALQTGGINKQQAQLIMQELQQGNPEGQQAIESFMPKMQELSNKQRREELLKMLGNFEANKYDLVVAESSYGPTTRFSNFILFKEMASTIPGFPVQKLIKMFPFLSEKDKNEMLQEMAQSAQQSAQQENIKYETELKKTEMANQSKLMQIQAGTQSA